MMLSNTIIDEMQPYILNNTNIETYLKYKKDGTKPEKHVKSEASERQIIKPNTSSFFMPKEYDSLFWCYYIIKNGDCAYETLNNKNILTTKQLKIEYVSKIRENKQIIKTYKLDTISNLESNLANDDVLHIKTALTLLAIDNINVIFVSKKTYFELLMNDTTDIYIIREVELNTKYKKKYGFEMATPTLLEEIRSTLYKIEAIDKPIKGLSSYKVQELKDIASKLAIETMNLETGKSKTKNELYELIIKCF